MCSDDDSLSYLGFTVTRFYDERHKKSIVMIKKGKSVMVKHKNKLDAWGIQSSCFGLYPVLGRAQKQLVIVQTSGGAHCCFDYRIYDLFPRLRLIFDGGKYPIGDGFDELKFSDLDGDGVMEFTQRVVEFDYCCDLAYVSSPQPTVVFKYDAKNRRFLPAPRRFRKFLLKGTQDNLNEFNRDPLTHWPDLLHVVLQYIYAGQEKAAWHLYAQGTKRFDSLYKELTDKKPTENSSGYDRTEFEIKEGLKQDPIYRLIYGRRRMLRTHRRWQRGQK